MRHLNGGVHVHKQETAELLFVEYSVMICGVLRVDTVVRFRPELVRRYSVL